MISDPHFTFCSSPTCTGPITGAQCDPSVLPSVSPFRPCDGAPHHGILVTEARSPGAVH